MEMGHGPPSTHPQPGALSTGITQPVPPASIFFLPVAARVILQQGSPVLELGASSLCPATGNQLEEACSDRLRGSGWHPVT